MTHATSNVEKTPPQPQQQPNKTQKTTQPQKQTHNKPQKKVHTKKTHNNNQRTTKNAKPAIDILLALFSASTSVVLQLSKSFSQFFKIIKLDLISQINQFSFCMGHLSSNKFLIFLLQTDVYEKF
jgi:hypothetical protein